MKLHLGIKTEHVSVDSNAAKISKLCAYCLILLGNLFGNIFIIIIVYEKQLTISS